MAHYTPPIRDPAVADVILTLPGMKPLPAPGYLSGNSTSRTTAPEYVLTTASCRGWQEVIQMLGIP